MTEMLEIAKAAIGKCTESEIRALRTYVQKLAPHELENKWGVSADVILDAIEKSSDLTKRGFRGILAESIFETDIVPVLPGGWAAKEINRNEDLPYDSLLIRGEQTVRVQVKLQRSVKGEPMLFHPKHYDKGSLFVVEVQKTRTGSATLKAPLPDSDLKIKVTKSTVEDTRPYRFGQFDILAVNMHPSTNDWTSFRYTLGAWLLARPEDPTKIAILQPVSKDINDVWTDDLETCLEWLQKGETKRVLGELKHVAARPARKPKRKGKPKQKKLSL
jgi:hypothetical protein